MIINADDNNLESMLNVAKIERDSEYDFFVKGEALRQFENYESAIEMFKKALEINPNHIDSLIGIAKCYQELKKWYEAIGNWEKAKEINNFDKVIHLELGKCYLKDGQCCAAIKSLIRAIRLDKKLVEAQVYLALAHEMLEEDEMALKIYDKVLEETPNDIKVLNYKATLLMKLEAHFEAAKVFRGILKLNKDFYRATLGIGICCDKMSLEGDAIRYYKRYLAQKPNSDKAKFVTARLDVLYAKKSSADSSRNILELVRG